MRHLITSPRPWAWLGGTAALILAARAVVLATPIGRQALVDQWVQRLEAFGRPIDAATFAQVQALGDAGLVYGVGLGLLLGLAWPLATALGIRLLGRGRATWPVALSLAGYAAWPIALREAVGVPVALARESLTSPLTLGTLFPLLDEASAGARLLWSIDLFVCAWLVLVATSVAAVSGRRLFGVLAVLAGAYLVVGLGLAGVMFLASGAV